MIGRGTERPKLKQSGRNKASSLNIVLFISKILEYILESVYELRWEFINENRKVRKKKKENTLSTKKAIKKKRSFKIQKYQ